MDLDGHITKEVMPMLVRVKNETVEISGYV